jgi:hypothetical protein
MYRFDVPGWVWLYPRISQRKATYSGAEIDSEGAGSGVCDSEASGLGSGVGESSTSGVFEGDGDGDGSEIGAGNGVTTSGDEMARTWVSITSTGVRGIASIGIAITSISITGLDSSGINAACCAGI